MTKDVMILAGAGQIGMAIARRMGYGMKIVIGDKNIKNAQTISDIMNKASFDTIALEMDFSSRESVRGMSRSVEICRHRHACQCGRSFPYAGFH